MKLQIRECSPIIDGIYVNGQVLYLFLIDTGINVNLIETCLGKSIGMNAAFRVDFASSGKALLSGRDGNEVQLDSVKANWMSSTAFCRMFMGAQPTANCVAFSDAFGLA